MNGGAGLLGVGRAVWQSASNQTSFWLWLLMLFIVFVVPPAFGLALGERAAYIAAASIASASLLSIYLAWFYGLQQQNHPLTARLVPAQLKLLQRAAQIAWLLVAVPGFTLSAWYLDNPLIAGAPAAVALLALAWTARHPSLWFFMWLPGPILAWAGPALAEPWHALRDLALANPWLCTALLLIAGCTSMTLLFGHGDEAHVQRYRKQQTWRAASRAQRPVTLKWQSGSLFDRIQQLMRNPYHAMFRRGCAQAEPGPVSLSRLMLVLGPQPHWASQLAQLVLGLAIGLLMTVLVVTLADGKQFEARNLLGLTFGGIAYAMGTVQAMRMAMVSTRHEQALLSLVPGLPRGEALNRALARRLMLQFLLTWLLVQGLLLIWLGGDAKMFQQLLCAAVCSLPMGLWLWADWSRAKPLRGLSVAVLYVLPTLLALLAQVALSREWLSLPALLLLLLAPTVPLALWRWQVAVRAPMAFPAGRNA